MTSPYDGAFFDDQRRQSSASAHQIVPVVMEMIRPRSVVDVGCGIGAWLSVFREHGVADVLGIDGAWVNGHRLPAVEFLERDLSQPFSLDRKFDLVVSLEVAEHLPPTSAKLFVDSLVALGSTILFSAAAPLQGGTNHLNEQWPAYWAALFAEHGYVALDWLRPLIWNNERVEWYYAQNSLLFVRRDSINSIKRPQGCVAEGHVPLSLVHPRNYLDKARRANIGLSEVIALSPSLIRDAVWRRLPRLRNRQPR
jgi:SAM-dependent methyltransferase